MTLHGGVVRPLRTLCTSLGVASATYYRARRRAQRPVTPRPRPSPPRALAPVERTQILATLHDDRFIDLAPAHVNAMLLDEGVNLCAERTMYRILSTHRELRDRRAQRRHAVYTAPELLATGPNQLWSRDIIKLEGPTTWSWYHSYVILNVFSRYAVGWMLVPNESADLAETLIATSCAREHIGRDQLTIHADHDASMTSKPVAALLADLCVARSPSRPHVSDDNPNSEAHFKTLKYRPDLPSHFGALEDARAYCVDFFRRYNTEHLYSSLGLHTLSGVQLARAAARNAARAAVLTVAYVAYPERFVRRPPTPRALPTAVWINPPTPRVAKDEAQSTSSTRFLKLIDRFRSLQYPP